MRFLTFSLVEKSAQKYDVNFPRVEYIHSHVEVEKEMRKLQTLFVTILVSLVGSPAFAAKETLTLKVNAIILEQTTQKGDSLVGEMLGVDWAPGVKKWVVSQTSSPSEDSGQACDGANPSGGYWRKIDIPGYEARELIQMSDGGTISTKRITDESYACIYFPSEPGKPIGTWFTTSEIIGGTGRFEGASGTVRSELELLLLVAPAGEMAGMWQAAGTETYDFSTK